MRPPQEQFFIVGYLLRRKAVLKVILTFNTALPLCMKYLRLYSLHHNMLMFFWKNKKVAEKIIPPTTIKIKRCI